MSELASLEWRRAGKTLASAKLLEQTDSESAASRAYYATFHALRAVFALRGQQFTKHSALRAVLHRDLIHTAVLPVDAGKDYDYLMDIRAIADYGAGAMEATGIDSAEAIARAEKFIAVVRSAFPVLDQPLP